MKILITLIALFAMAGAAQAQMTACYGWEDAGTALGEYGLVEYYNDGTHVSEGFSALAIREIGAGTGQIYAAWICGLAEGDEVTASFDVYDDSEGSLYTSTRIWGHYTEEGDINAYTGSASGNYTYSDGLGWNNLSFSWIMPAGQTCLVVELRPYGASPYDQDPNWIDNLCVTAPEGVTIYFPGGTVDDDQSSFGTVKALFR